MLSPSAGQWYYMLLYWWTVIILSIALVVFEDYRSENTLVLNMIFITIFGISKYNICLTLLIMTFKLA